MERSASEFPFTNQGSQGRFSSDLSDSRMLLPNRLIFLLYIGLDDNQRHQYNLDPPSHSTIIRSLSKNKGKSGEKAALETH